MIPGWGNPGKDLSIRLIVTHNKDHCSHGMMITDIGPGYYCRVLCWAALKLLLSHSSKLLDRSPALRVSGKAEVLVPLL